MNVGAMSAGFFQCSSQGKESGGNSGVGGGGGFCMGIFAVYNAEVVWAKAWEKNTPDRGHTPVLAVLVYNITAVLNNILCFKYKKHISFSYLHM
jgi:hypothetical protein